jgi:CheY-like chemotaxis protein
MESTTAARRPRILLVDDSFQLRAALADALTAMGNDVTAAQDSYHALELFAPDVFDVVLTDYAMPRRNGLQLAEEIRHRAPGQRIVLLSGHADGLPLGERPKVVDLLLRKPIALPDLGAALALMATARGTAPEPAAN